MCNVLRSKAMAVGQRAIIHDLVNIVMENVLLFMRRGNVLLTFLK